MSERARPATPEQQHLYWFLAESLTKAKADYLKANAEYAQAKAEYERMSDRASDAAAAFVDAEAVLEAFVAEYPGISLRAFRPEHIESAFSATVETWEL